MELPEGYFEKFRRENNLKTAGAPRSNREELVAKFLERLNEECKRDGYPLYTTGRLVKMFDNRSDSFLYQLFNECSEPAVKKFGAIMKYKLKPKI